MKNKCWTVYTSVHFIQVATIYEQSDGGHRGGSAVDWYMNTAHVRNNLRTTCWVDLSESITSRR